MTADTLLRSHSGFCAEQDRLSGLILSMRRAPLRRGILRVRAACLLAAPRAPEPRAGHQRRPLRGGTRHSRARDLGRCGAGRGGAGRGEVAGSEVRFTNFHVVTSHFSCEQS